MFVFFFKQNTAYDMRISDWSSDVCSSDLGLTYDERRDHLWGVVNNPEELLALDKDGGFLARYPLRGFQDVEGVTYLGDDLLVLTEEIGRASCRARVCQYV